MHAAAVGPAQALLAAMHAAGSELGDASLLGAYILSGWRSVPDEGSKFRGALQRHLRVFFQNPKKNKDWEQWAKLTIPQDVLDLAEEQLVGKGHTHSVDDLRKKLAQAPGWNPTLADKLVNHTKGNKAPSRGSPHHSGVVIDINWPSATADGKVEPHDVRFERNDEARRSAAGVWLSLYAKQYGFASYNTAKRDLAHGMLDWRGSAADPSAKAAGQP